ncbi:MAG: hypothetical protein U5M23_09240 [Marinagarivorans sp.]|nr:hypothetical protein [Marinagarivorans sp.]
MHFRRLLVVVLIISLLTGCTSLIVGNRMQSAILGALFESVLGFNPNDVKILENPAVKSRMQAMLGDKYDVTVSLLREAQKIQRDGAAYYILAKTAPVITKTIAEKTGLSQETTGAALALVNNAGMSWDSNLNQFSVLLVEDGVPKVFSEAVGQGKESVGKTVSQNSVALLPALPKEMQAVYDQASELKAKQEMLLDPATLIDKATQELLPASEEILSTPQKILPTPVAP